MVEHKLLRKENETITERTSQNGTPRRGALGPTIFQAYHTPLRRAFTLTNRSFSSFKSVRLDSHIIERDNVLIGGGDGWGGRKPRDTVPR